MRALEQETAYAGNGVRIAIIRAPSTSRVRAELVFITILPTNFVVYGSGVVGPKNCGMFWHQAPLGFHAVRNSASDVGQSASSCWELWLTIHISATKVPRDVTGREAGERQVLYIYS